MRDYGRVHVQFWSSPDIRSLTDDGRTLALYLMTSAHTTLCGTFRLPDGYACEDLQWPSARLSKGFRELFAKGFANRCETTKWVWIRKHLSWNALENPNQRKAARKIVDSIPDTCAWKLEFIRVCGESLGMTADEIRKRSETLPQPFRNQDQDQEQEQEQEQESIRAAAQPIASADPDGFDEFRKHYPKRAGSQRWPDARKHFRARRREGYSSRDIVAGASRYAEFVRASGKEGTELVQQAATFLGTNLGFTEAWTIPKAPESEYVRMMRINGAPSQPDEVIEHDEQQSPLALQR